VISRRKLLIGCAGAAAALAIAKPREYSGGHTAYFAGLNAALRRHGIDRPVLLIDLDRLDRNIERLVRSAKAGAQRNFRIAVKSVPSLGLIEYIAARAGNNSAMVFHRPFLQAMARLRPDWNLLLGKPMPAVAAAAFYNEAYGAFEPSRQLQWLIDSEARLAQYLELARARSLKLRVNLEIDVGLHRGGFPEPAALTKALQIVADHPQHLTFSGFMGYDGHIMGLPQFLAGGEAERVKVRYAAFIDSLHSGFPSPGHEPLTFNGAGSPTFRYHEQGSPLNDIAVGSALLKPAHYDLRALEGFEPAAFIATPVLKRHPNPGVPTMEWLSGPMAAWDGNTADLLFAYGGNWLAEPESPAGVRRAGIYKSSNQEGYYAAKGVPLAVDDFLFLRPTQAEAVLLQFGDLVGLRGERIEHRWPVLQAGL
jgi:D-serine deaminase-like pyridoxal phosphate-dependent protein